MLTLIPGLYLSTEVYVILFTVAALLVGLIVKPLRRGQAETLFAEGMLDYDSDAMPKIEIRGLDNGDVVIIRSGLADLTSDDTVALAITKIGFDLDIEERISRHKAYPTPGYRPEPVNRATFFLKGLAQERYHIKYNSSAYSTFIATNFPNKPGITITKQFPT